MGVVFPAVRSMKSVCDLDCAEGDGFVADLIFLYIIETRG